MKAKLIWAALTAALILAGADMAEARGRHHHTEAGWHHRCYATAVVPQFQTVNIERTTTVNRTSRAERKMLALGYLQNNDYLTVSKYCGITGLDRQVAEAELDSFTIGRKATLARTTVGKKVVYTLNDE